MMEFLRKEVLDRCVREEEFDWWLGGGGTEGEMQRIDC